MTVNAQSGERASRFGTRQRFGTEGVMHLPLGKKDIGQPDLSGLLAPAQLEQGGDLRVEPFTRPHPSLVPVAGISHVSRRHFVDREPRRRQLGLRGACLRPCPV